MNRFYLNHDLASRFGVSYYDEGRVIVALSTLRESREWDSQHCDLWDRLKSEGVDDVVAERADADPYGWFTLVAA